MIKCTCNGTTCKRTVKIIKAKDRENEYGLLVSDDKEDLEQEIFVFMDDSTIFELINELIECLKDKYA